MRIPGIRLVFSVGILINLVWSGSAADERGPTPESSLLELQKILASKKFIDLTHEFAPGIPHWPGFPDEQQKTTTDSTDHTEKKKKELALCGTVSAGYRAVRQAKASAARSAWQ